MKIILIVCCLFITSNSQAQTATLQKPQRDSLWYTTPFLRFYPIVMNNGTRLYRVEAEALFSDVPESLEQYRKYRNRSKVSLYSYAGIFVGTAVGVLGFNNNNRGLSAAGITFSVYSFFNAIIFGGLADGNLKKAIKIYNRRGVNY